MYLGRKGNGQQLHVNMLKKWNTPSASVMAIAMVAEPSEMSDEEGEIIICEIQMALIGQHSVMT